MAHVIKPAGPEDHEQKKCPKCRATIAYLPTEIKRYSGRDYSGGPDGREWIICPNCSNDITLRAW